MKSRIDLLKGFLLDLVSFNTPLAIVINLSLVLLVLGLIPSDALSLSPMRCVFKEYIIPFLFSGNCPDSGLFAGCACPACGLTRAISALLHGDIPGSLSYNKMAIPLFLVMISLIIINIAKLSRDEKQKKHLNK